MLTPSSRRRCLHHHRRPYLSGRPLPLRPRLALVEGRRRQQPVDQKGLNRGILDVFCSCPIVRLVGFGKVGRAVQSTLAKFHTFVYVGPDVPARLVGRGERNRMSAHSRLRMRAAIMGACSPAAILAAVSTLAKHGQRRIQ